MMPLNYKHLKLYVIVVIMFVINIQFVLIVINLIAVAPVTS
jgi:hypothetical protein